MNKSVPRDGRVLAPERCSCGPNFFAAVKPSTLFPTRGMATLPRSGDKKPTVLLHFDFGAILARFEFHPAGRTHRRYASRRFFQALLARGTVVRDPDTGQPFPNNQIPLSRLNPVSAKIFDKYLPAPNLGAPGQATNNFGFTFPYPTDLFYFNALEEQLQYRISSSNTVGRAILSKPQYVLAGNYPGMAWTRVRDSRNIAVEDLAPSSPT